MPNRDLVVIGASAGMEDAFWAGLRALAEKVDLARRLAERARIQGHSYPTKRFQEQAEEGHRRAALLRTLLQNDK